MTPNYSSLNPLNYPVKVTTLLVEYLENPIGVGELRPRLSWRTETEVPGWKQAAYQIRVWDTQASFQDGEGVVWDTGKVSSDQSVHVEYDGPELRSEQRLWWQVRVWQGDDSVSEWSQVGFWQMALLKKRDWQAKWIGSGVEETSQMERPPVYLRKSFALKVEDGLCMKRATVHATAHGLYELHLNGEKVGDDLLTPGWTTYHKRLQFQSYDVTEMLQESAEACLGAIVGDGWFRGPFTWQTRANIYGDKAAFLCQLHIEYSDGSEEWVVSDEFWMSHEGPIRQSEIYNGEVYDARLSLEGWSCPNYPAENWIPCPVLEESFEPLVASCSEPVRVTERLSVKDMFTTPNGETVLDFGQNLVGRVCFQLKGNAGERIVIEHAEVLDADGNFYTDNLRSAKQRIDYTFAGGGVESYSPHFTFMGFRYIRVSAYTGSVRPEDFIAEVFHSDMRRTGNFECSDPLINQLQSNIQWGLRGNFVDVPTDCPQRDERMGWTGDAQVFTPTACFNVNAAPFLSKWLKDVAVEQRDDGSVPWVVPNAIEGGGGTGWSDGFGSTAWSDVAVLMPWEIFKRFGDARILKNQYASMKGWVEYMIHHSGERCIFDHGFHFGDWLSFAEYMSYDYVAPDYGFAGAHTDKDLIATAYFYYSTSVMEKVAGLLGFESDAKRYRNLLPKIRRAFVHEFVTETGRLASNTQTAYVVAIAFGVLPEAFHESARKRLVKDIRHLGHLTTGFVGTPIISNCLSDLGCDEEAFQLLFNKRYPSWLFPVTQGATTIWERWDGIKPDGSFQDVGMNSFNHYAYGSVGDWLYSRVAGLQVDETMPGYKHFLVRPSLSPQLSYVKLELESMYGPIRVSWELDAGELTLEVEVPPNTEATVYVPHKSEQANGGRFYSLDVDYESKSVGSGTHTFHSKVI